MFYWAVLSWLSSFSSIFPREDIFEGITGVFNIENVTVYALRGMGGGGGGSVLEGS